MTDVQEQVHDLAVRLSKVEAAMDGEPGATERATLAGDVAAVLADLGKLYDEDPSGVLAVSGERLPAPAARALREFHDGAPRHEQYRLAFVAIASAERACAEDRLRDACEPPALEEAAGHLLDELADATADIERRRNLYRDVCKAAGRM